MNDPARSRCSAVAVAGSTKKTKGNWKPSRKPAMLSKSPSGNFP